MDNETSTIKIKKKNTYLKFINQKYLQAMVLPGIIWMIVFNFIPMVGIIIAFKDYTIIDTIWSAPWVGFQNFIDFFKDENFAIVMKNTLGISFLKLLIGFPLPILFAILLSELYGVRFRGQMATRFTENSLEETGNVFRQRIKIG